MRLTTGFAVIEIILAIILIGFIIYKWNQADSTMHERMQWVPSHIVFLMFFVMVRSAFHVKLYLIPVSLWIDTLMLYVYAPSFYLLYFIARYTEQVSHKRRGEYAKEDSG